jgi:histidinol phosphatase-like enzyme (inositol monophosphatase family)
MLDTAIDAAKAGSAVALKYFKNIPKVSFKPDNSPVTIADKTAEKVIRAVIARKFPDHGIVGEEHEATNPEAKYQWYIDPIDGTRDYIRGLKLWATFVAVAENGKVIAAVALYPTTSEIFTAKLGRGTYLNGKRVHVSKIKDLKNAYMVHGQITRFETNGYFKQFMKAANIISTKRNFGSYNLPTLLKGNADICIEPGGGVWDFAAPSLLVTEAGGKFSDFSGHKRIDSNNAVMSNGLLHQKVLKILAKK